MSQQALVERVLTPVGVSGDNVIYLCPKCNDRSGHLYVNYSSGKYNCVRCKSFKGRSIGRLLKDLGVDTDFNYEELDESYDKRLDEILGLEDKPSEPKVVDYSVNLDNLYEYYNLHTMPLTYPALMYLYSRGLNDNHIISLGIREGVNRYGETFEINGKTYKGRDYSGRVMVPSLLPDGKISFYLGRDYTGVKVPKYSNAPQELAYSSEDVWSLNILGTNDVVICEGVFTAIAVNIACNSLIAVATYGKSIASKSNSVDSTVVSTSQGDKLLNKKFNTYYVFYDLDAKEEACNTAKYLSDRGAHVKIVNINSTKYGEKADAADMTKEEILECLRDAKDYDRFSELDL